MPLADYSHHNEEAPRIWWEEEGKHSIHVDHYVEDYLDDDDYETEAKQDDYRDDEPEETA